MAKKKTKPTGYSPTPAIWRLRESATAAYTTQARQQHMAALKAGLSMEAFDLLAGGRSRDGAENFAQGGDYAEKLRRVLINNRTGG